MQDLALQTYESLRRSAKLCLPHFSTSSFPHQKSWRRMAEIEVLKLLCTEHIARLATYCEPCYRHRTLFSNGFAYKRQACDCPASISATSTKSYGADPRISTLSETL